MPGALKRTIDEARCAAAGVCRALRQRMQWSGLAELILQAVAAHRERAGPRVYIFVQAYNTRLVDKADLPKTYVDLLHPRWKGRIAIEGKEQEWLYTLVQAMGEAQGL